MVRNVRPGEPVRHIVREGEPSYWGGPVPPPAAIPPAPIERTDFAAALAAMGEFDVRVLSHLPIEPVGLSVNELADGILDDRSPGCRARIVAALEVLDLAVGGLFHRVGTDDFGRVTVLYGIPRNFSARVARFLTSIELP